MDARPPSSPTRPEVDPTDWRPRRLPLAELVATPLGLTRPAPHSLPAVFASPHSGRLYPEEFLAQSRVSLDRLRHSEDAYMDLLMAAVPALGAPLLAARFPRTLVDVNREPYEWDPALFEGQLPDQANSGSLRVRHGLGTLARVVAGGEPIYDHRLPVAEGEARLADFYWPYHQALGGLIGETRDLFGLCVLIDCHSMPGGAGRGGEGPDIVLGDCHGASAAPELVAGLEKRLKGAGFRVVRNRPYAGGHTTQHYGRPGHKVHAVQVEVARPLYMDPITLAPRPAFAHAAPLAEALVAGLRDVLGA
ncbi:N-formylglutamate amidohydrolase [Roseospirillum parvum]|uniref:N-formylglutamate deformylase n=1 Tax=Roseospirillum parvum TaxID=83401 RepID=A0A1G8CRX1_9PROT|nr:N-formylglutamate amidohydrolase [Roseospirillum parvum]SDH48023.1 N-formylglutamate deformylase [Roseospirillum parvum]